MANKTTFSPASEKGRFDGLVDEGKDLRQSSLYKQILPRTPGRPKTSVNPVILSNFSSCSSCLRGEKIRVISVNPRLIKDLRLRILTYEKIGKICKTNPISEKGK